MKNEIQTAWSNAVNDKNNYPFKDSEFGHKIRGRININHYITYNIVRGLPLDRGLENNNSYYFDRFLIRLKHFCKSFSQGGCFDFFAKEFGKSVLFPFEDKISLNEFMEKANEALCLYSNS